MLAAQFEEHLSVCMESRSLLEAWEKVIQVAIDVLRNGRKLIFCGNGGSATDGVHIAAEFVGRFLANREPISAVALGCNMASVTAIANDFGYEAVFARELRAIGHQGDLLFALSTSGNSKSVIECVRAAKELGIESVLMSGGDGGALANMCDTSILIPSQTVARIQEMHILLGHLLCYAVDAAGVRND